MKKTALLLLAIGSLSACVSSGSSMSSTKFSNPAYGVVDVSNQNYKNDRQVCENASFAQARTYDVPAYNGLIYKSEAKTVKVNSLSELSSKAFDEYRYAQTPAAVTAAAVSSGNTQAAVDSMQHKPLTNSPASDLMSQVIGEINSCMAAKGWVKQAS